MKPIRLVRGFVTVGAWTLLSRVVGFLRDMLIAAYLGAGPLAEAFLVAFSLPNMFRRFFAEGAFNTAFVPMFSKKVESGQGAQEFARDAFTGLGTLLIGFTLVGALAVRQPFCRICPLLAFNAVFQRLSPMRLKKTMHENCGKCGICTEACPMDIPEIAREEGRKAYSEDCTLCGRCAEYCPQDGIIQLKWGPLALFSSRREYYKNRVKGELPDGTVKPIKFVKTATKGGEANA